jgi:hypothetical protein
VRSVASLVLYRPPPDQLEAAAFAAIDSASKQPATASELVRAALVGMLNSIGHGAKMLPTHTGPRPNVLHTSFRDVENIRIVIPDLDVHKMSDLDCSGFDEPFDLSHSSASGVILDLRGNQGASLNIAVCLANQLVRSDVPIFTIQTTRGRDTQNSRATSPRPPLTIPVVIFIDKDTNEGALGLAAALQDQRHAKIIGEQRQKIDDTVMNLMGHARDTYMLPIGEMLHADGRTIATGVRIDVAVRPSDDDAMMAAARKEIGRLKPATPLP